MSVYNLQGQLIPQPKNVQGNNAQAAYDINGNAVFPDAPLGQQIKVMSYNVGGWYIGSGRNVPAEKESVYYSLQTGMIENNDPDILIIQEYLASFSDSGTSALSILQSLFPYVKAKTSGTYFGRAFCSKYPITNYVTRTYTQESSRYFDSCTITIDSIPITVVTTHLGLTQADRTPEIEQLIGFLDSQERFIAGGDYNTAIVTNTANKTSTDYINNVKPFVDAGFHTANFGDYGFLVTCNDGVDGGGIDWYLDNVYTSSNIIVSGASVDTTKLTDGINEKVDHMPLIATLTIGGTS